MVAGPVIEIAIGTASTALILAFMVGMVTVKASEHSVLESPQRRALLRVVRRRAGITVTDLMERLPFQWGSFYYHLRLLEEAGLVETRVQGRRRHIYPVLEGQDPADIPDPDPTLGRTAERLARVILRRPGLDLSEVAERADVPVRNVYYHIRSFVEQGLVVSESETRYRGLEGTAELRRRLGLPEKGSTSRGGRVSVKRSGR